MQISAIFSDYDGTLSPTTYLNSDNKTGGLTNHRNQIQLYRVLRETSNKSGHKYRFSCFTELIILFEPLFRVKNDSQTTSPTSTTT
jgi:hypothetical protein